MLAKAIILIPKSANKGTEIQMEVLPLVLCKDCKHGRQYDTNAIDCEYRELATEPDWFCADGERRTVNDTD